MTVTDPPDTTTPISAQPVSALPISALPISALPIATVRADPVDPEDVRIEGEVALHSALTLRLVDAERAQRAAFHGMSALLVNGGELIALTDEGWLLHTELRVDRDPLAVGPLARFEPLVGPDGALLRGAASDTEALARLPDGDVAVVSEKRHRLLRYDRQLRACRVVTDLGEVAGWRKRDDGMEALVTLADGRLFGVAQREPRAWVVAPEQAGSPDAWRALDYPREDDFDPSGATRLPGGDVVVVERRKRRFRLRRVLAASLARGGPLVVEPVAEGKTAKALGRAEGVAALPGGRLLVLTDNNGRDGWHTALLCLGPPGQG